MATGQLLVDEEPVSAETLGLRTVGAVLRHLDLHQRFVTQMLIDGKAPGLDAGGFSRVQHTPLAGRTVYVETTAVADAAADVIEDADALLGESRLLLRDAGQSPDHAEVLRLLGRCFGMWAEVDEAVRRVCEVLRVDPNLVTRDGHTLAGVLATFATQLRDLRTTMADPAAAARAVRETLPATIDAWRGCLDELADVTTPTDG